MIDLIQQIATIIDFNNLKRLLLYQEGNPMLFNSGLFLILFLGFLFIYQILRKSRFFKMIFVILFSLYFYYKSSAECCFILLGVCVSDYVLGNLLSIVSNKWQRRSIVAINVLINVGMLVYFKYFQLILNTITDFTSIRFDLSDIILPAGISFFTFRSISYVVDVYRRQMEPVRNILDYIFFLTFFPPLLAGPVVRAKDLIPQIKSNPIATRSMVSDGYFLIMTGLIKKVVIADYISENFVDRIFDNPTLYSGFENIIGIYGFTLQLYCDFSGYSDMAIGIALLFGFRFRENFNSPFKSQNPTEFWHRWHISLSTWLRDYIYIPLGGNRISKTRSRLNLLYTMIIGGIWHGASWMFLIWGVWNGLLLIIHKELKRIFHLQNRNICNQWWRRLGNIFLTFSLIAFGMMFFRATSMNVVYDMLNQIWYNFHINIALDFVVSYNIVVIIMLFGLVMHLSPHRWTIVMQNNFNRMPAIIQSIILTIVIFIIIQARQSDIVPFIYLQY